MIDLFPFNLRNIHSMMLNFRSFLLKYPVIFPEVHGIGPHFRIIFPLVFNINEPDTVIIGMSVFPDHLEIVFLGVRLDVINIQLIECEYTESFLFHLLFFSLLIHYFQHYKDTQCLSICQQFLRKV